MSVNTVRSAKNRLKQIGLIDFKSPQNGSKGFEGQTKYLLTVSTIDTVPDTVVDTVPDTVVDTVPDTNNKLNKTEESIYSPPGTFFLSTEIELPANVLESAQMNQFTKTKNNNTDFIYENWRIFLSERVTDPPGKKMNYRTIGDVTSYFLNWIRDKHPKNGTPQSGVTSKNESALNLLEKARTLARSFKGREQDY